MITRTNNYLAEMTKNVLTVYSSVLMYKSNVFQSEQSIKIDAYVRNKFKQKY